MLLNLEPDHLDRHGTWEAYRDAKLRIFENQGPDVAVVPRGFGEIPGRARRVEFSADDALPAEPRIPGEHNQNAAAAVVAAREAGAARSRSPTRAPRVPRSAAPPRGGRGDQRRALRQRLEGDECFGCAAGDRVVRRGRSTSSSAGSARNESYDELAADLRARGAEAYLIGAAAGELAAAVEQYELCGDLVTAAAQPPMTAEPGDVVLLSQRAPADQFQGLSNGGTEFRRLVEELR